MTDSPQKLKLENVHGTFIILFYVNPSSPPLQSRFNSLKTLRKYPLKKIFNFKIKFSFSIKNTHKKTTTLQQMNSGKIPNVVLKLASAIFIKFLFFHQTITLQKLWKAFFISSKKLFSFSRYSKFYIFSLLFHTFQIEKEKWKWNNLWCHELASINFLM